MAMSMKMRPAKQMGGIEEEKVALLILKQNIRQGDIIILKGLSNSGCPNYDIAGTFSGISFSDPGGPKMELCSMINSVSDLAIWRISSRLRPETISGLPHSQTGHPFRKLFKANSLQQV